MPPAKTIIVDTPTILANIARIAAEQAVAAHAAADITAQFWTSGMHPRLTAEQLQERAAGDRESKLAELLPLAEWVPRSLETLAGKSLTASERIRHQQAMRKLEADGLVVLDTRHVRLTEQGKAQLGDG